MQIASVGQYTCQHTHGKHGFLGDTSHTHTHPPTHLLGHPLGDGLVVLRLHVGLPKHDGGQQAQRKLDLLRPRQHLRQSGGGSLVSREGGCQHHAQGPSPPAPCLLPLSLNPSTGRLQQAASGKPSPPQPSARSSPPTHPPAHLVVAQDGDDAVEGRRQVWEVEAGELPGGFRGGKDHGVTLPLQPAGRGKRRGGASGAQAASGGAARAREVGRGGHAIYRAACGAPAACLAPHDTGSSAALPAHPLPACLPCPPLCHACPPVLDVQLLEQVHEVGVGAEEDVQASLVPVAVLVLPGSNLRRGKGEGGGWGLENKERSDGARLVQMQSNLTAGHCNVFSTSRRALNVQKWEWQQQVSSRRPLPAPPGPPPPPAPPPRPPARAGPHPAPHPPCRPARRGPPG